MKSILILIIGILLVGNVSALTLQQNVTARVIPIIYIYSPLENSIYNSRMVLINLSSDIPVDYIRYSDNNYESRILCRDCVSYSREKPFDDGRHNITIFATFEGFGAIIMDIRNITTDSKMPILRKTEPTKGFANSNFSVEFQEENPISLIINYGNNVTGYKNNSLDLNKCNVKRLTKSCEINVNLSQYDQQGIIYWFEVIDIAGNVRGSRMRGLDVDFSKPIINSFNYTISKRISRNQIKFTLNITEPNFDGIEYLDKLQNATREPVWKNLCKKLDKNGICERKMMLKKGQHDIMIRVLDEVGNFEEERVII